MELNQPSHREKKPYRHQKIKKNPCVYTMKITKVKFDCCKMGHSFQGFF
jgi:hypothetical protein